MPLRNIFESTQLFITRFITITYYNIRDHFDPIPPRKRREHIMKYVSRVDKKYAIRYLDRQIWGVPNWDLEGLKSYMNSAEFPEEKRQHFEDIRSALQTRRLYVTIKETLLRS